MTVLENASVALAFMTILSLGLPSNAIVISHNALALEDPRLPVNFNQHPELGAVGRLENEAGDVSTAFLINKCYVLTSRHSAFHDSNRPSSDTRDVFKIGRTHSWGKWWYFADAASATPVAWGGSVLNQPYQPGTFNYPIGDDWAVLRLDPCLPKYPILKIARVDTRILSNQYLASVSDAFFPAANSVLWDTHGKVHKDYGTYWAIDNAVITGDSGGPVLIQDQNSTYEAIGLISSEDPAGVPTKGVISDEEHKYNYAVDIASFYNQLKNWL